MKMMEKRRLKNCFFLPDAGDSWILAAVFIVGNLVVSLLCSPFKVLGINIPMSLLYALTMVPPVWWIFRKGKKAELDNSGFVAVNKPDFGNAGAAVTFALVAVGVLGLAYVIEPLYSWLRMPDYIKELFDRTFSGDNHLDLFISASVLAPLCEEFLCRGTICRGMLAHTTPVKSILMSSLIFAVIHMNPWQAIPAFIIGCFLGWVYYRTHSYWTCVFIHFINNTNSQIMGLIFPDTAADDTFFDVLPKDQYYIFYFVAVVLVVTSIYLLNKKLKCNEKTVSFEIQAGCQE